MKEPRKDNQKKLSLNGKKDKVKRKQQAKRQIRHGVTTIGVMGPISTEQHQMIKGVVEKESELVNELVKEMRGVNREKWGRLNTGVRQRNKKGNGGVEKWK